MGGTSGTGCMRRDHLWRSLPSHRLSGLLRCRNGSTGLRRQPMLTCAALRAASVGAVRRPRAMARTARSRCPSERCARAWLRRSSGSGPEMRSAWSQ
jgi:hypothetical protein